MPSVAQSFPTFEVLSEASIEDVAHALLATLPPAGGFSSYGIVYQISTNSYPQRSTEASRILSEAFQNLANQDLIACDAIQQSGTSYFVSRLGKSVLSRERYEAFKLSRLLPAELLHPIIVTNCMADFKAKRYAAAVRNAWVAVEDAIRQTSPEVASANGSVPAARNAFATEKGSLTDLAAEKGEREALMHLMAGALGYYRDAHTLGGEDDPVSAGQILAFASNLISIVESRLQSIGISLQAR